MSGATPTDSSSGEPVDALADRMAAAEDMIAALAEMVLDVHRPNGVVGDACDSPTHPQRPWPHPWPCPDARYAAAALVTIGRAGHLAARAIREEDE